MATPQELVSALREHKAKANEIRTRLDAINKEKEQWFLAKSGFSSKIKALISQIKELRLQRDSLTKDVKDFKVKRNSAHKELMTVAPEIKDHSVDRELLRKRPEFIKTQMDRIETAIETSGMSFEKEKELMKKLKALKKEFQSVTLARAEAREIRDLSAKVHDLGKEAQTFHHLVVHKAGESQKVHEQIVSISKQIDALKPKEKEALSKFLEFKKQLNELYPSLKSEYAEMDKIKEQLDKLDSERVQSSFAKKAQSLEQLKISVEDKIKGKKKLTLNDLLIFQKEMGNQERKRR